MDKLPLVSVGLPTYNRAGSLRRAVESVLAQDYANLELVVSDNASDDETRALCEEYRERDRRVRYLRQEVNLGACENFKRVLAESRGEFFMWLADDDWIDSNYVSSCVEFLLARPDCHVVGGRGKYFNGAELCFEDSELNLLQDSGSSRVAAYYGRTGANGLFYGMMRRAAMSGTPPLHVLGGDWLFLAHMAFRGKIKTLSSTSINRSLKGLSQDAESIGRHYGLSDFEKKHLYLYIAATVFKDIAWRSPVFGSLGQPSRWLLACRCSGSIVSTYSLPRWLSVRALFNDLRARLILRTRVKLFIQRWTSKEH